MARRQAKTKEARRALWRHVKGDACFVAWRGLAASDVAAAFAGVSIGADICYFVLAVEAVLRLLLFWPLVFLSVAARQACSFEFWLGLGAGVATRAVARAAIMAAFAPEHGRMQQVAVFAACAGAGFAAGFVVHLVRVFYRNLRQPAGAVREKYWSGALLESAVTGLAGGFLGGFAAQAGAMIAQAGSVGVGVSAGISAGVLHAAIKLYREPQEPRAARHWGRWAFEGMAMGVVGGVTGFVSADLFGAAHAIAATFGDDAAAVDVHVPVAVRLPALDTAQLDMSHSARSTALHEPVLAPVDRATVAAGTQPWLRCEPVAPNHHVAVAHHHHHRHLPAKAVATGSFDQLPLVIIEAYPVGMPLSLLPPQFHTVTVVPIVGPPVVQDMHQAVDPCAAGNCALPCQEVSQVDPYKVEVQGPCADPDVACVERVSFDSDGNATRVVLEPAAGRSDLHFEVAQPDRSNEWNHAAQVVTADDSDASKVSLVVPFATYASAMMDAPSPA